MKKLYCAILLLAMPCIDAMQKKNKSHKKFNIHNTQKKTGKKNTKQTRQKYNRCVEEKLDKKLDKIGFVEPYVQCRKFGPIALFASFVVAYSIPIVVIANDPRRAPINWSAVIEY